MQYAVLFISVFIGIAAARIFYSSQKNPTLLLAFSGAYLISVSVLHLLPEIYHGHNHTIGLIVMGGFLFQVTLDFFSKGIEHGHHHSEDFSHGKLPITAMAGLFIHAFFEGMPLGGEMDQNGTLLMAIVFHKIPITVVLYFLLANLKLKPAVFWTAIIGFAVMAPLGAWAGDFLMVSEEFQQYVMAFVVGIFFHVSTTILYETSKDHTFNILKLLIVLLGVGLAYLTTMH